MTDDTRAVLLRLKRRVAKDKRFFERILDTRVGMDRERPLGESKVCLTAIAMIDRELRKMPKAKP